MECLLQLHLKQHKGVERIFISYPFCTAVNAIVRALPGARYSGTCKQWHIPVVKEIVKMLVCNVKGVADVDTALLRQQLADRKQAPAIVQQHTQKPHTAALSANNCDALTLFVQTLVLKAYSQSTIRTYRNEFYQLLKEIKDKPVQDLTIEHIRRYMFYCLDKYKLSEATANSRINAVKFYFEQVLQREKMFVELPRPKTRLQLPRVLGENELSRLFNALSNVKHKAILFTAYSAGLRVSEVMQLKLQDVDSDRMQLFIQCAKGKKDRYVTLSPVLLDILRGYIAQCSPRPIKYVFESPQPGICYCAHSAQKVFQNAKRIAGIKKDVSFHVLRHSFATHLLEKGISAVYIRDILGHFSIKTTERYLHVKKEHLVNVASPLDDLWKKGNFKK